MDTSPMSERELHMRIRDLEAERDDLRSTIGEQSRCITDLMRHNKQLREAISALLQPAPSELLPQNIARQRQQNLDKAEHDGT